DLVFLDADKGGYLDYLTAVLDSGLLAPNGVVCVDNTLMQGQPWCSGEPAPNGRAIVRFNEAVAADPRVEQVLLPLRDGLTLIRRAPTAGPDRVDHLQNLLARHGVVIMRGQDVDDPAFLGFLRRFGELAFTTREPPLPGHPDLNLVSNVGRPTPPRSTFHVDTSYVRHPPAYTALRAVRIPAQSGETLFTNQYRAYDTLPADVREGLRGRTIRHEVTGLDLGPDDETAAEHPVFRPHPISGRTALYLSTPQRCTAI